MIMMTARMMGMILKLVIMVMMMAIVTMNLMTQALITDGSSERSVNIRYRKRLYIGWCYIKAAVINDCKYYFEKDTEYVFGNNLL